MESVQDMASCCSLSVTCHISVPNMNTCDNGCHSLRDAIANEARVITVFEVVFKDEFMESHV